MKNIIFLIFSIILVCCGTTQKGNEREILEQKLEAFQFLSKYHHQLHVMIGEEEGNIKKAYDEFYSAIITKKNIELIPIKDAFSRIEPNDFNSNSESVQRLDYLVDYYQSGLSMQIEGVFRGHGYLEVLDIDAALEIYDRILR